MRVLASRAARALCVVAALAVAGCGGGGGKKGSLALAIGVVTADYVVVDLATGTISTRASIPDLDTNDAWRTTSMVFRAVDAANVTVGSPAVGVGSFGHQPDEAVATASLGKYYLGVFEVTQAQWQAIAGTTPWTAIMGYGGPGAVAATKPAFGLTYSSLTAALATWNGGHGAKLAVPTGPQWEYACRAGSAGAFSWGDARDEATVGLYAYVAETTTNGVAGARRVGGLAANAFGFYDMHGNVWEWTRVTSVFGDVRGGSWNDTLAAGRCANKVALVETTVHPLVGARLVLSP